MITLDLLNVIRWWAYLFLIGAVNLPLTIFIFKKFADLGYGFSKVIGIVLISYISFIASTFHFLPFTKSSLLFVALLLLVANGIIFFRNKKTIVVSFRKNLRVILFQEILFTAGLVFWAYVRGHQPDINGLEKFMDYGFINSILNSDYLPPADMWFAGKSINYYWFGHFITAVVTKLSNIPSSVTYNLMLATILGFGLNSAFSISGTLLKHLFPKVNEAPRTDARSIFSLLLRRERNPSEAEISSHSFLRLRSGFSAKGDKRVIFAAGIISAAVLIFGGNFHTPFYVLKDGRDKYWYPDATRFIGYNPETNDKTIHEFPIYSFVVSDLHAHLLNFPLVLLYIALLWRLVAKKKRRLYDLIFLGFLLGVMFITSAWDFGNYTLVTGITLLITTIKRRGFNLFSFLDTGISTGIIICTSFLASLPFLLNFESIAQGLDFVNARSPLWQLSILWGFPAVLTIIFGLIVFKLWPKVKLSDLFVGALLISSWFLIFLPELIYVKDIYIASHHRANTMFKLTYQAFVMSYLASGYIVIRSILHFKNIIPKLLLSIFYIAIFTGIFWYPSFAIKSYYRDLKNYIGLDGEYWLLNSHPDTYAVITWMRQNIKGQPIILEAPGDSYTEYNVISSYTGLPTISGWFVHEWLWRGTAEIPQARVSDISEIYTSEDLSKTTQLLKKYGVSYVIIGEFERMKYPNIIEEKFSQLGKVVFSQKTSKVYQID